MPFDRKKNTLNIGYEIKCTYKSVMPTSLEISWAVYLLFRWLLRFLHCLFESEVGQFSLHLRQTLCQSDIPFSNYELTLKNFPNSVKLCICEWPCFVRTFIWFQIHFFNTLDPFQIYFYNRVHRLNGIGKSYLAYYHPRHRTKRYCAMLQYTLHIKHTSYVYKNIISFESKKEK